jgi:squalene-hopene/tetraprenyl-beta-curcumene cyclase
MRFRLLAPTLLCLCCAVLMRAEPLRGEPPITLADVAEGLPDITADEPPAASFSARKAAEYLDRSALNWQKTKKCVTCHTNLFYMASRPALRDVLPDSGEVRRFYEDYRDVRWKERPPKESQGFWTIVVAAGLTLNDMQSTGKLSPAARDVLNTMWTTQRADGGWTWPDCNYAPLEIDDHYGATVAALAVGLAPDDYRDEPHVRAGLEKLRAYFRNNPPKSLHHRAMIAWTSLRIEGLATDDDRRRTLGELLALQLPDGGWSTAGLLTDWNGLELEEGRPLQTKTSDGYGTGLVMVIARELGVAADDARLRRGVQWIRTHQRESGKWFTRSPVVDAHNLISNAGSAYVVLALQACGELPPGPFGSRPKRPAQ